MPRSSLSDYRRCTLCIAFAGGRCTHRDCPFSHSLLDPQRLVRLVGDVSTVQPIREDRVFLELVYTPDGPSSATGTWLARLVDGGQATLDGDGWWISVESTYPLQARAGNLVQAVKDLEVQVFGRAAPVLYARGDPRMTVCKTFEDSECGRPSASCSNRHDLLDAKIIEALFERRVGFATISYVSAKDAGLCWKTCVIREREDDVTSLCQSLPDVMRAFANISSKDDDEPSTISYVPTTTQEHVLQDSAPRGFSTPLLMSPPPSYKEALSVNDPNQPRVPTTSTAESSSASAADGAQQRVEDLIQSLRTTKTQASGSAPPKISGERNRKKSKRTKKASRSTARSVPDRGRGSSASIDRPAWAPVVERPAAVSAAPSSGLGAVLSHAPSKPPPAAVHFVAVSTPTGPAQAQTVTAIPSARPTPQPSTARSAAPASKPSTYAVSIFDTAQTTAISTAVNAAVAPSSSTEPLGSISEPSTVRHKEPDPGLIATTRKPSSHQQASTRTQPTTASTDTEAAAAPTSRAAPSKRRVRCACGEIEMDLDEFPATSAARTVTSPAVMAQQTTRHAPKASSRVPRPTPASATAQPAQSPRPSSIGESTGSPVSSGSGARWRTPAAVSSGPTVADPAATQLHPAMASTYPSAVPSTAPTPVNRIPFRSDLDRYVPVSYSTDVRDELFGQPPRMAMSQQPVYGHAYGGRASTTRFDSDYNRLTESAYNRHNVDDGQYTDAANAMYEPHEEAQDDDEDGWGITVAAIMFYGTIAYEVFKAVKWVLKRGV